jgi:hypothetical protein
MPRIAPCGEAPPLFRGMLFALPPSLAAWAIILWAILA